ncbi:GNAT family N-acetyltransferase [Nocardioides sp. C4-1]|uniref:GNAT family N-acetyltransferase n=1 Tax=Nocardioides sp. C4-1 TaxID=3151851 RepID=UPI003266F24E
MSEVRVAVGDDVRTTTTAPGESWYAAACRLAPGGPDPVAVDLSGEAKQFCVDGDTVATVRAMTRGDLPDVVAWRSAAHVARWWFGDGPPGLAAYEATYGPRIDGRDPVRMGVWEVNGRSIGLVQDYRVGDKPDYALLAPDPEAVGVDYLVGRVEWVGRGVGTRCLWAWLLDVRRRRPDAEHCFAAPDHRNRASLRVLAKVGFVEGLWFDQTQSDGSVETLVGCTLDLATVVG